MSRAQKKAKEMSQQSCGNWSLAPMLTFKKTLEWENAGGGGETVWN